ncbi:MAG: N-acetyl sugar amidotransferase [Bacteroidales bacterium]|jgi:N-acetyl sugar amidotransferase
MGIQSINFYGLKISVFSKEELIDEIISNIKHNEKKVYFGHSLAYFVLFKKFPEIYKYSNNYDIMVTDGRLFHLFAKMLGAPLKFDISIPFASRLIMDIANEHKFSMMVIGSTPEKNKAATENLRKKYPNAIVYDGYDGGSFSEKEQIETVKIINKVSPDILFIGVSSPKKEIFTTKWKDELNVKIIVPFGGMIDGLAGKVVLTPLWLKKMGLAHLIRTIQEPKRFLKLFFTSIFDTFFIIIPLALFYKYILRRKEFNIIELYLKVFNKSLSKQKTFNTDFKKCSRCISDTTMSEIEFDENGVCNFCHLHDKFAEMHQLGKEGEEKINKLVNKIKNKGRNKNYDCIVGVSGGTDSTFLLYWAVKIAKLRVLAVTFDNGWSSDIAVSNIKNATEKLGVDLHTVVADWEEKKDLQRSFLKASVSDADAPTDYAIYTILYREAINEGVCFSLNGHSFRTEGTVPKSWSYFDGRYIRSVHKKFGTIKLKHFPIMTLLQFAYYVLYKKIRDVRVFDYIEYDKAKAKEIIKNELGWKDYGGHHHENIFTRFFQSYYLPVKFNIDKRKVEYSALIRSGQMKKEGAVKELKTPYQFYQEDINYVLKKLDFSQEEWENIMKSPRKSYKDFPSYYHYIVKLRFPLKIAAKMNLIPKILYEKYAKM